MTPQTPFAASVFTLPVRSGARACWRWSAAVAAMALATTPSFANAAEAAEEGAREAEIIVVGQRANLLRIPGSGATIEAEDLRKARVFTVNEALRQATGVVARDEEGLGLRPNIGVRGLSPTRSSKVLLLEDGLPLTYAPYGDNATYSHPSVRRFERIEILKGAGQVRFGPNTVGGVVNYITPRAPDELEARATLAAGSRGYQEADLSLGGPVLGFRALAHFNATRFDGVRDNHALAFDDAYLKLERDLTATQAMVVRLGLAREDSQVSYSGLTLAEFRANPRANPFRNDRFETERFTASATHSWTPEGPWRLTTSAYTLWFDRDWWRQSSNSAQRPADASDPACGGMANLETTCGNEGRLREYNVYGAESRLAYRTPRVEAEAGVRWHTERQNRLQVNGDTPTARTPGVGVNGGLREANLRYADALAAHATARVTFGRLALSPGLRIEHVAYERRNLLNGARGETDLTETIPSLGLTYDLRDDLVIYAGAHRGFAPPRVEDVVTNAGGAVDLKAEESVNLELGLRGAVRPGIDVDVGVFHMAFDNQIVPASIAGGLGAALTSAGETRHAGLEASGRASLKDMGVLSTDDVTLRAAVTWLAEASYEGRRLSSVPGFSTVSVSGNRLPYAPEVTGSIAIGYDRGTWLGLLAELQWTSDQYTDDLNTAAPSADGQRGRIDAATTLNLTANLSPNDRTTFYVTVKNATDDLAIVDRARGILPNAPRLVQAGVSLRY
ncbi:MAG: TonB-dependent receptor [Alphaproteobacteria bacterium]|nr:TonB-dependent receptor [Alphaproteobacteria bacterium]